VELKRTVEDKQKKIDEPQERIYHLERKLAVLKHQLRQKKQNPIVEEEGRKRKRLAHHAQSKKKMKNALNLTPGFMLY